MAPVVAELSADVTPALLASARPRAIKLPTPLRRKEPSAACRTDAFQLVGSSPKRFVEMTTTLTKSMDGVDPAQMLALLAELRNALSCMKPDLHDEVVIAGMPKVLVRCLAEPHDGVRYAAAWALTNLSAGEARHSASIVKAGGLPALIDALLPDERVGLAIPRPDVVLQCAVVLSNMRDEVLTGPSDVRCSVKEGIELALAALPMYGWTSNEELSVERLLSKLLDGLHDDGAEEKEGEKAEETAWAALEADVDVKAAAVLPPQEKMDIVPDLVVVSPKRVDEDVDMHCAGSDPSMSPANSISRSPTPLRAFWQQPAKRRSRGPCQAPTEN
eukprot:TRINITY_DN63684_c0_g1_i1.p1 TRINITY_DN63684_c0_g1~~TRINITY_DN63684_c0_g1_i1.p1  ORF type:complete len:364 (-),score=84.30 TRINITY_DN63684_c0_g1_i1:38-1030(-)